MPFALLLAGCGEQQRPAGSPPPASPLPVEKPGGAASTPEGTTPTVSASESRVAASKGAAPAQAVPPGAKSKGPNLLLIYTDDQSWRTLSCYEGTPPWVSTPNVDRLASEGVRFTHCYGAPTCIPSRLSMLTGLLPHAIPAKQESDGKMTYDPQQCRFWPAVLREAGYHTAVIGKWHLSSDVGQGRDWDRSVLWEQPTGMGALKRAYRDPPLRIDGQPAKTVSGYSTDLYSGHAVEYIRRAHDRPWFLWLCYNAPHHPIQPHPRHQDLYRDAPVRPPLVATPVSRYIQPDPAALAESVRNYHRTICAVDDGVAEIRKALEETGQLDNTVIVFTSDNGFAWGDNGVGGKLVAYDAHMRVPLIVRFPRKAQRGAVCRSPVALVDLPPTLLALAGVKPPWPMHGHDLEPLLANPQSPWDHPAVLENFYLHFGSDTDGGVTSGPTLNGVPWWISLADVRYHYIRSLVPDVIEELYDRAADPLELANLALEPKRVEVLVQYRQKLTAELRRTKAALVDKLPPPRIFEKTAAP